MRRLALMVLLVAAGGCEKAVSVVEPIATANDAKQAYDIYVATIKNPIKLLEVIGQIEAGYLAKPANYKDVANVSAKLIGENDTHLKVLPEPINANPARSYSITFYKLTQQQCQALLDPVIIAAFSTVRVNSASPAASSAEPLSNLCIDGINSIAFVPK